MPDFISQGGRWVPKPPEVKVEPKVEEIKVEVKVEEKPITKSKPKISRKKKGR